MSQPGTPPASVMVYVGLDRVTWVAGKETSVYAGIMAPVVKGILDEVIENAGIGQHPKEFLRRPLPGRRFDLIIDTQKVAWASLSLKRVPHRLFISSSARFLLSSRKPPKDYQRPKSMLRQLLDLLELASGKAFETPAGMDLELDPALALAEEAAGLLPEGPVYVGIAPGAGGGSRSAGPCKISLPWQKNKRRGGASPYSSLAPRKPPGKASSPGPFPKPCFPCRRMGSRKPIIFLRSLPLPYRSGLPRASPMIPASATCWPSAGGRSSRFTARRRPRNSGR